MTATELISVVNSSNKDQIYRFLKYRFIPSEPFSFHKEYIV